VAKQRDIPDLPPDSPVWVETGHPAMRERIYGAIDKHLARAALAEVTARRAALRRSPRRERIDERVILLVGWDQRVPRIA
jgi:hypothetical protein